MMRIRGVSVGDDAVAVLERTASRRSARMGWSVSVEVPRALVVDVDVRRTLELARDQMLARLRGRSTAAMDAERVWVAHGVVGAATRARTEITLSSRTAAEYLGRVYTRAATEVMERVLASWTPVRA